MRSKMSAICACAGLLLPALGDGLAAAQPQVDLGACCLPEGQCVDGLTEQECFDQDGTEFVSDGRSKELVGEPGGGAPEWLRLRVGETARSLEDESRPELEPEVERALRALGYVE